MATIGTTTNAGPWLYPANTMLDRSPTTGYLYAMVRSTTANQFDLYRSTNNGSSWSVYSSVTRTSVAETGSIYIGNDNVLSWCYRTNESSQDRVYYRRILLSGTTWEGEVQLATPGNGGVAGAVHQGLDLVAVRTSSVTYVAVAVGTVLSGSQGVTLYGVRIPSSSGPIYDNSIFAGSRQWLHTGTGRVTPSIDLEHLGDGKSATTPHLWVAHGRTEAYVVKLSWNGAGWTGPTSDVIQVSGLSARDDMPGRWDGAEHVTVTPAASVVNVHERNRANSQTTLRTSPAHPAGTIRGCGVSYNNVNQDIRVYATGTSTAVLYYVDYVRSTDSWTSWTQVLATAILGSGADNFGVRRGSGSDARQHVYTAHSGAPNTLTYTQQTVSYAPNTPTWVSPQTGAAQNVAATLALDWEFSDADPADTQSAYAVRRQIGAGAYAYYRASDGTWQVAEQKNVSTTSGVTVASSWGADGDANHTYAVKVWDASDTASAYSAGLVVVPSSLVNPSFTAPGAGATITTDTVAVSWSVAQQTAYRLTLTTDPGGVLTWDSGWVTSTATTVTPNLTLPDLSGWTIGLTTKNNEGLASTTATRSFTVDYIEPPTPTLTAVPEPGRGWIQVTIINPAPSGGQPALADQDVYRRPVGDTSDGVRVAVGVSSGAVVTDWRAVSGVEYEYRVAAHGVNGTTGYSAWTA